MTASNDNYELFVDQPASWHRIAAACGVNPNPAGVAQRHRERLQAAYIRMYRREKSMLPEETEDLIYTVIEKMEEVMDLIISRGNRNSTPAVTMPPPPPRPRPQSRPRVEGMGGVQLQ